MSQIKLYNNPEFDENIEFYQMADAVYGGEQKTLKDAKYLWMHELETKADGQLIRQKREERSTYTNFIEPVISLWISHFFQKEPTLDDASKTLLGDLEKNIDGEGNSLNSFIQKKLLSNALVYGTPIVRVNSRGQKPKDLKEQRDSNKYRPYMEVIDPKMFVDWEVEREDPERLNKINWCRLQYCELMPRTKATDPVKKVDVSLEYRLNITEAGNRTLSVIKYVKKEPKKNDKEKEPVWEIDTKNSYDLSEWSEIPIIADLKGISWIKDLAPHVLKYFNLESVLDNICLYQAHQKTFLIGELEGKDLVAVSEYTMNTLPEGTVVHTIEPVSTVSIENRLDKVLNNIFRIALNQTRMMSADAKSVQGADTLKAEKENLYNLVKAEAEGIENIVNQAINMIAQFKEGKEDFKAEFKFNLDTTGDNIDSLIKIVGLFRDEIAKLPTARKQLITSAMSSLNVDQSPELLKEIDDLIKEPVLATPEVTVKDRLLNGLNNPKPSSPPAS